MASQTLGVTYKRPESVLVLVYTSLGDVLMLRRTRPTQFWQSVTGSLNWGESPRQAALRELYEETGLRPSHLLADCRRWVRFPIVEPWRRRYAPGTRTNLEHWFRLQLPDHRLVRLNPAEHTGMRWLPLDRAARLASSWSNRQAILSLRGPQR